MRPALRLAVTLALVVAQARAADTPQIPEEIIVALTVNGEAAPQPLLVRRDADGALLIRASDLPQLRIRTPAEPPLVIEGVEYYRVSADTGANLSFDAAHQSASLTLPASAFQPTRTGANGADTLPATTTSPGAFVNYDLFAEHTDATTTGAVVEAGVFGAQGVGTGSLLARDEAGRRDVVRLDTTWNRDFPERLATLRVGDAISGSGAWGRSVRFGGVQFATNFATQPTLVTTPLLSARGEAVVPSTVDVFVNGQRRASEAVPPGPFEIDNVPTINGAGQMQVVITDALGRQQVISQPYYSGSALLREGLSEFSFEAGAIREDYAFESNAYGAAVLAATLRRGLRDTFTAELHGEAQAHGPIALGVDTAVQLGSFGILGLTAAAGGDDAGTGWLAGIGLEHSRERFSLFARSELRSESFVQLGTSIEQPRPKLRGFGGVGVNLERYGTVQLAYGTESYWSAPTIQTIGLSHSISLGARGFVNASATLSEAETSEVNVLVSWTMPLGGRRTTSAGLEYQPDRLIGPALRATASIQQSLPPGSGHGYLASISSSDDGQLAYSYQGRAGRVSTEYARRNGQDGLRAEITGALALTGAGLTPSRRLDRSFAVVDVADYAGLTVYVDNQPVARTDTSGRVLLDSLREYEQNSISIDPVELPMDASLAKASMTVVPAHRSGAVVRFPVSRVHGATLRLELPDGAAVPSGARVELDSVSYPVALDGLVYIPDLPPVASGQAAWPGHRCEFELPPPSTGEPVPDLGVIRCEPGR
jgi:outer membrane usher protein